MSLAPGTRLGEVLVTELLEGETLRAVLDRGPLRGPLLNAVASSHRVLERQPYLS